jgi:hypothetical protein
LNYDEVGKVVTAPSAQGINKICSGRFRPKNTKIKTSCLKKTKTVNNGGYWLILLIPEIS